MEDLKTINIDVSIVYYWYDHMVLRQNGDAEKVTEAIAEGDYDTFIKYYNYYNYTYEYEGESGSITFFPSHAALYYHDEVVGMIDITEPLGFSMICESEYECG